MSTVFVLCIVFDYEGEAVLGVYSSLESAQAAAERYLEDQDCDGLTVYECGVGAPAFFDRPPVWER